MIATQDYGWSQLARRRDMPWPEATDWAMDLARQAGFDGWEPYLDTDRDARRIGRLAGLHGLAMPSVFVSGDLHSATGDLTRMADAASAAAEFGAGLVAVYPSALNGADKSDAHLAQQAANLSDLAHQLSPLGLKVLYHPEEPEMRHSAREFHHVLAHTDPALVGLCLDSDTFWRGLGRTTDAVLAVIDRYGDRLEALHIRQSHGGIWTEALGPGDIDYPAIAARLTSRERQPLLVVEHAYQDDTPDTLDPLGAHQQSLTYVRATFGTP